VPGMSDSDSDTEDCQFWCPLCLTKLDDRLSEFDGFGPEAALPPRTKQPVREPSRPSAQPARSEPMVIPEPRSPLAASTARLAAGMHMCSECERSEHEDALVICAFKPSASEASTRSARGERAERASREKF